VLFGCPLFGGDTDRTPGPVTVSIAMFGSVPEGTMVRRTGAKAGDCVFVTGTIEMQRSAWRFAAERQKRGSSTTRSAAFDVTLSLAAAAQCAGRSHP
jgi:thiamine monophosphate kinase